MSELSWYVLRAVSGQEKKIKAYLEKEVINHQLTDFIAQVLVPGEKVFQMRKSRDGKQKKVTVEKYFFPGYVIIQANLAHGEVIHVIKSVPGVLGFLNVDGNKNDPSALPRPMREVEINRILGKVEEASDSEVKHEVTFTVGESVKVIDGPFSTFPGIVSEVFDERKKINVIVTIFGRGTPVELQYTQVEKIE